MNEEEKSWRFEYEWPSGDDRVVSGRVRPARLVVA